MRAGRITSKVAPLVSQVHCFDISSGMLDKAKNAMATLGISNVDFNLLETCTIPSGRM